MKQLWRQKLHLEPEQGWLNDPNGLCWFRDRYHVYFQYAPDSPAGKGDKCWGHFESADLLHWTFTGTVLRPDIPEDRSGVYSGCAVPTEDLLYLFYTGNVKEPGNHDYITSGRGANVICVTTPDGRQMSEKKTLLRNADYPDDCTCHVRDPKVWMEDGCWHMVLGARRRDDTGCILLYTSENLTDWQFDKALSLPDFGYMWECPDVFDVDGHKYLSLSPQGVPQEDYCFQNVYSAGYLRYDETLHSYAEWDSGFDFYAPQTFAAPDGRRILIGWMGIGDIPYTNPTTDLGWQHCLTVPRELTAAADGSLRQQPVRELEALRGEAIPLADGEVTLPFDLTGSAGGDFSLRLDDILTMDYAEGVFTLRFLSEIAGGGRTVRRVKLAQCDDIRILADTSSLEIYLGGGERVLSTRFYPETHSLPLSVTGLTGVIYPMQAMEVKADVQ